jgi:hypothetical protein
MSISGIMHNLYTQQPQPISSGSPTQQLQQLSQDIQSGNTSAAQSDFATLQQAFAAASSTTSAPTTSSTTSTSNPLAQAFNQLGSDIQSGNLSAAQKDLSTVQQDLQSKGTIAFNHFRHIGGAGGSSGQSSLLQDLGQTSTSASQTAAQQAYTTLAQQFQQAALGAGSSSATDVEDEPALSMVA